MFRGLHRFNTMIGNGVWTNRLIFTIGIVILPAFLLVEFSFVKILIEIIISLYELFVVFILLNRRYLSYIKKKNLPIVDEEYILIERFSGSQAFPTPYEKGSRFRLKETYTLNFLDDPGDFFVNFVSSKGEKLTVNYVSYIECFELLKINRNKKLKKLKI